VCKSKPPGQQVTAEEGGGGVGSLRKNGEVVHVAALHHTVLGARATFAQAGWRSAVRMFRAAGRGGVPHGTWRRHRKTAAKAAHIVGVPLGT